MSDIGSIQNSRLVNAALHAILSILIFQNTTEMENTFEMEPKNIFLTEKVGGIIREVLELYLENMTYKADESKELSMKISDEIKRKVKEETLIERYKLVCVVWIGQDRGQGVYITSRCLWNSHFDNFAQNSYKNDHIFAHASVFALFVE